MNFIPAGLCSPLKKCWMGAEWRCRLQEHPTRSLAWITGGNQIVESWLIWVKRSSTRFICFGTTSPHLYRTTEQNFVNRGISLIPLQLCFYTKPPKEGPHELAVLFFQR